MSEGNSEFKKSNEELNDCWNWSIENKTCKLIYNNKISPKFDNFKMNINDYDLQCNGKSNPSRCIGFCNLRLTEKDLRSKTFERVITKNIIVQEKRLI